MGMTSELCQKPNAEKTYESFESSEAKMESDIRSYKRRFWQLLLFSTLSMFCGMVFPLFVSMSDLNMCYYGVTAEAINWTSLIFMVVYIFLVFPVSWMMNKVGLRIIVCLGSLCNTLSCAVQYASASPDRFLFVMMSSFLGSLSNVFVLAIPPCLAAIWFPNNEVSRACAAGVFGNQLGVAIGFVLSPLLISSDCNDKDLISYGKKKVSIILTSLNLVVLILLIFTFHKEPKCPPSIAQAEKKNVEESYLESAMSMAKNINFILVFLLYGFMVGIYFCIATLLNAMIISFFPGSEVEIGWMGLIIIVAGLVGSIIAGCILDYTHRFKEVTVSICILSLLSHILFSCVLLLNKLWVQFVTLGILGFFLTSFLPVGFEYAIEVTYPESEITSSGLLNSSAMIFGIVFTEISSAILEKFGTNYANVGMSIALLFGTIVSCFITRDYKRSKKNEAMSKSSA